ncbi:Type IV secretory pathway, VirB3-like protein [Paracoccus halophilus]|uniref:Type IV secretory pathway, VirB3-like protein n=1 Tax=Paracoccus halophilus TaxID=376733 RepID=A0A1I0U2U1_9RHOB|nr:VirB3 family type IV secretion system protein [Paracoccus halophilus]SFA58365.1 Type IV secretory pathway, VirB3-like protein [Paracoccus halophilus]
MTERTPVILGLSRQANLAGLPMPYTLAVGALIMLPFIWFKWMPWLLTGLFWYPAARVAAIINPHGHRVLAVIFQRTPPKLAATREKRVRRYV